MKIKSKIGLIVLGSSMAILSPVIILSFIQLPNIIKKSPIQVELEKFYNSNKAIIFAKDNFTISQPEPEGNKYLVKNIDFQNIILNEIQNLNNSSYGFEVTKIHPSKTEANFTFDYIVFSLKDKKFKLDGTSAVYSQYMQQDGEMKNFSN